MRFPLIWQMPHNNSGLILIEPEPLEVMDQHWQNQASKPESGGILLGYRRESHLHVVAATPPQANDVRRRFWFSRSARHHQAIALKKWNESSGTVGYLGEWHTHPEAHPRPSALDRNEWQKICRLKTAPMLFMIVGWSGNIWVGSSAGEEIYPCLATHA